MSSLEEKLESMAQTSSEGKSTIAPTVITGVFVTVGLLYAFKKRSGLLGYFGYGFLGLLVGAGISAAIKK